jgi:hypothetical protein
LVGRLTLTPRMTEGVRTYEYAGEATLGRLLAGSLSAKAMVTPAGFDRLWNAQVRRIVKAA